MYETGTKRSLRGMSSKIITLDETSESIQYLRKKDKRLAKAMQLIGAIKYTPHEDSYSFLIHEILEQMLSTKVARRMYERLSDLCNGHISPAAINSLTDEQIKSIGTSGSKVACIRELTNAIIEKRICFDDLNDLSDNEVTKLLCSIRGIGNWTAKMYLIFVLDRPDVLPFEDYAFLQGYKWLYKTEDVSRQSVEKRCKKWKPYSSIASRYMYKALDLGFTKDEFHLYKDV